MGDTVVRVEGLGKQYRIGARERYRTLRETVVEAATAPLRWLAAEPPARRRGGEPHLGAAGRVV